MFRKLYLVLGLISAVLLHASSSHAGAVERRLMINEHGALGDGKTVNTKAIQAAIDDCAKSGGGTIVVPNGTFVTGAIFLKQGVNLCVEKGGVLKGSQNTNDYPWIDTRIAGLEMKWPAALINADGVTNLQLTGEGTIDGSGERWWKEYWTAREAETNDIDPHFKVGRPRLVHIIRCQKVLVRDLLLKDSAFWNLQLTYCDGIEVNHLRVIAPPGAASSDGVDIDSSRNVLVTDCDIVCDDDAICLKSGRDADGLRVNRPTENVEVRNCHVGHAGGLVVFGSETSGGIRHVRVHDCKADNGCKDVVRFKTRMGRGGVVEDVVYEDIEAEGVRQVLSFNMDAFGTTWVPDQFREPAPVALGTPIFRNITVRNLKVNNCAAAGHVVGLPESPIQDIKLENIEIQHADKGFTLRYIRGIACDNVKVNGKQFDVPESLKLAAKDKTQSSN